MPPKAEVDQSEPNVLKKRHLAVTGWSREMYPTKSGHAFAAGKITPTRCPKVGAFSREAPPKLGGSIASMALCWLKTGSADPLAEPASSRLIIQFEYLALLQQARGTSAVIRIARVIGRNVAIRLLRIAGHSAPPFGARPCRQQSPPVYVPEFHKRGPDRTALSRRSSRS